jgi:hypothetical protein
MQRARERARETFRERENDRQRKKKRERERERERKGEREKEGQRQRESVPAQCTSTDPCPPKRLQGDLAHKKTPTPKDPSKTLGTGLR